MVRLGNSIGNAGVKHIADMLKVNTTLTELVLGSELCLICIFSISFKFISVFFFHSPLIRS